MAGEAAQSMELDELRASVASLFAYCREHDWAGFDPYDALNSRLFGLTPFRSSRLCRIAFIQAMKRLPVNIRPLLLIPEEPNPKALALFLMSFVNLSRQGEDGLDEPIRAMTGRLEELRSRGTPYWCWGYSFPWQTRTNLVPKGAPNLVCSVFVANALLDLHESGGDAHCLEMAVSTAEYLLNELYWSNGEGSAGFSYPLPGLSTRVHNANFLGAALLGRVYRLTGEGRFLAPALRVARYSAQQQQADGAWYYGEHPKQRWVDNFHTGFNLCALRSLGRYAGTAEFEPHIRRGFDFYCRRFFTDENVPRYFHDRTYPVDIHSVAQSIITLSELDDLGGGGAELARGVLEWALRKMRDKRGYFYYQVFPLMTNRIPYMRWSQAWMLLALTTLLKKYGEATVAGCPDGRYEEVEVRS